jgi:thiol:disulfide interchange protein DsbD
MRTLVFALLAGLAVPAQAQPQRVDHVEVELVAATDAVVPGQPLEAALRIKHDPEWHTYWRNPGDSGLPTQLQWQLPVGWSAGPIQWPVPKRLPVGPLMNYGYEGELLLPVQLTPPAGIKVGDLAFLAARADWLMCKDVCIPGGADLKLMLPVKTEAAPSRQAAAFAATRALIPQPAALAQAQALIDGDRVRLEFAPDKAPTTLEFFPFDEGRIAPAALQVIKTEGGKTALYLTAAAPVAPEFKQLSGVLVADGGSAAAARGGWAAVVEVPLAAGTVAATGATAAAAATAATAGGSSSALGWAAALLGALLGGLILNLMPCVFPVLSLKLLGLMQHQRVDEAAHRQHRSLAAHGVVFTAGVVLSFVLLAGALLALRAGGAQLGWGFQLQSPWVVAALTLLFFLIGLNLLGAFEFAFGGGVASSAVAQRLQSDKLAGSFWTGVLAVVVAAPCTAPFMGAALGFAMTQNAAVALSVFAALGLGMAAPYLLLTLFPRLLARLPRPGLWMERFKQVMAFPMFATCVWLLWVLAQQVGVDALALLLAALVLAGLAAWAYGLAQRGGRRWGWVAGAAAAFALYVLVDATVLREPSAQTAKAQGDWQPWSPDAVAQAQAAGRPVFVDFTAAWCVTCQANKRLVLASDQIKQAFAGKEVLLLRADWTQRDAQITAALASYGRNGVPLYVLHDARGGSTVLPEILTAGIVLDALAKL